jgi:hypothetical protein
MNVKKLLRTCSFPLGAALVVGTTVFVGIRVAAPVLMVRGVIHSDFIQKHKPPKKTGNPITDFMLGL